MKNKIEVYTCLKCKHVFKSTKTTRCPICGSLEVHKTNAKPLNIRTQMIKKYTVTLKYQNHPEYIIKIEANSENEAFQLAQDEVHHKLPNLKGQGPVLQRIISSDGPY